MYVIRMVIGCGNQRQIMKVAEGKELKIFQTHEHTHTHTLAYTE
jgi:hypothetical protein